jgi:hypothetical protein
MGNDYSDLEKSLKTVDDRIAEEEKQLEEQLPPVVKPTKVEIQRGFDSQGRAIHRAMTTIAEVPEEHLYVIYKSRERDIVIEADLLGDQAVVGSDGKLPPMIHIECPICTKPNDRSALSITYTNKPFEIEDIDQKDWGVVTYPDGSPVMSSENKPAIVTRRLTVKDAFRCSYCQRRFRITDNIMSDA